MAVGPKGLARLVLVEQLLQEVRFPISDFYRNFPFSFCLFARSFVRPPSSRPWPARRKSVSTSTNSVFESQFFLYFCV